MTEVKRMQIFGPLTTTERDALGLGPGDAYKVIIVNTTPTQPQLEIWNGTAWISTTNANGATILNLTTAAFVAVGGINDDIPVTGTFVMDGYIFGGQASDKAAANDLDIWTSGGDHGNSIQITGSTQINAMKIDSFSGSDIVGTTITLIFASTPTVKHNTAGGAGYFSFELEGGVDFVAQAGDRLVVNFTNSMWREVSRTRAAAYSGTYTPTLTNVANLSASTAYQCQWSRVGNIVTVSGKADVDPTLAATATQLGISLPVASNLGAAEDCAGTAFASGIAGQGAAILGDAANNRAEMNWVSGDITNQPMYFTFTYEVI